MSLWVQGLLQQTSKFLPFTSERRYETPHDPQYNGTNRSLITQVPVQSEEKVVTTGHIRRLPMRRKTCSENPRLRIENGEHSHYLRPPLSKDRRFGNDLTASWKSFKTKIKSSCVKPTVTMEWEQGMVSQIVNITAGENKEISENHREIEDVVDHSSSIAICSSQKDQEVSSGIHKLYAIKAFSSRSNPIDKAHRKRIIAAFDLSSSLDHQNIVRTFDLHELSNGNLCESFEHCSGGDLYSLIIASRQLAQTEANCFFKQLMHGIHYIHKMGVAHCDLKPENILLSSSGCLKISNIGTVECFHLGREGKTTLPKKDCCPNPYVPPERYLGSGFDPKAVDIWAAAIIYIAMRTGRIPWKMANDKDECFRDYIIDRMIGRVYFFIEDICNVASRRVIYSMLDIDYAHRARSTEILCSQWLLDIKTCTAAGSI